MSDISPQLLESIKAAFDKNLKADKTAAALLKEINDGSGTYIQAQQYADRVGQALASAFSSCLSSDILPDGKMYQNIAEKIMLPMLKNNYSLVSNASVTVQSNLNKEAEIGLKAQTAAFDSDRATNLVYKVSSYSNYDDAAWVLREPIKDFTVCVVDNILKKNAEFQAKSGLLPVIVRKAESKCCKWCSNLEGVYQYPDNVPKDVYRRHDNCRCTVDYKPGNGKKQNIWNQKQWTDETESDKIELRKLISNKKFEKPITIPKSLGAKAKDILVSLPNGDVAQLTPGSRITKIETIAGLGKVRRIDEVDILVEKYPSSIAERWKKKKGIGYVDFYGESYKAELHWYEEPSVGNVRFKIKPKADGGWFYDD